MEPNDLKFSLFLLNRNGEDSIYRGCAVEHYSVDKHSTDSVRTKALIIHFLLDKSPHAESSDGPSTGWKAPTKCHLLVQKITNKLYQFCSGSVHRTSSDRHVQSPQWSGPQWRMDLINYQSKCDLSCPIVWLISCLCVPWRNSLAG